MKKGDRVIVHGYLNQDRYENKEGKNVSKTVLVADAVGNELRFAAKDAKTTPEADW